MSDCITWTAAGLRPVLAQKLHLVKTPRRTESQTGEFPKLKRREDGDCQGQLPPRAELPFQGDPHGNTGLAREGVPRPVGVSAGLWGRRVACQLITGPVSSFEIISNHFDFKIQMHFVGMDALHPFLR